MNNANFPTFARVRGPLAGLVLLLAAHAASAACTVSVASDAQIAAQNTFSTLAPGSTVCIAPGTYSKQLAIANAHGTATSPLNFVVGPTSGTASFTAGVLLRNVSYLTISGLTVSLNPSTSPWGAVILDTGTSNTTVKGLTVQNSFLGIALGSAGAPAGPGNSITGNVVQNNWNTGIAIGSLSDGNAGTLTLVQSNRVLNNGGHGIEVIDANYAAISGNIVSGNGTGLNSVQQGGYSGIHLFSAAASSPSSPNGVRCTGNVVAFNNVIGTLERPASVSCSDGTGSGHCTDGNGIQVDRYCSGNTVYGNMVAANAGNGISIYGATNNSVYGNYAYGNNKQVNRLNFFPGPAEIAVSAIGLPVGAASGNTLYNNTAITTVNKVPALYVSANAGTNMIGGNNIWWWTSGAGPSSSWGPVYIGTTWYSTDTAVNAATGTTGNVVGLPPQ